jgi:hypothetical protein
MIQQTTYPQDLFNTYSEAAFMSEVSSSASSSLNSKVKYSTTSSMQHSSKESPKDSLDCKKALKKRKPYSKACDWCRHHKKRCIPTDTEKCLNCVKANIECLDTTLRKRKPSKSRDRYNTGSDTSNSPPDSTGTISPPHSLSSILPPLLPYSQTNSPPLINSNECNFVILTPFDINSSAIKPSPSNALVQASRGPTSPIYVTSPIQFNNKRFSAIFNKKDVHFVISFDLSSSSPFVLHPPVRKMKLGKVTTNIFQEISQIPNWKINQLITWFFQYLHPHHPVVDPVSFCNHWLNNSRQPDFLLLFGVVCTLGSGCYPPGEAQVLYPSLRRLIKKYMYAYSKPSLFVVQALLLICPCLDILSEDRLMERGWYYQGIAYRYALQLGLHIDRPDLPFSVREMRKRIWWTIACRDLTKAHSVGWPNFFSSHDTSMSLPKTSAQLPPQLNVSQFNREISANYFTAKASFTYLISQMTTLRLEFTSFIKRSPCNQFPFISQRSVYDTNDNKMETYQKRCLSLEKYVIEWYKRLPNTFKTNYCDDIFHIFNYNEQLLPVSIFSVNLHVNFWSLLIEINMPLIESTHPPLTYFESQSALSRKSWDSLNPLQKCQIAASIGSYQMESMLTSFVQCIDTYKWWCVINLIRVHVYLIKNCGEYLGSTLPIHQRQLDMLIDVSREGSKRHCVVRDVWYSLQPLLQEFL